MSGLAEKVVAAARAWVGRDFAPGQAEQCANFVRHVFGQCGTELPVTAHPLDEAAIRGTWVEGVGTPAASAASLSGPEIGSEVREPRAGDLVFFENTYGNFPPGTITHIGIVTGPSSMVDRSTSDHPVMERGWQWGVPVRFVRPKAYGAPAPTPTADTKPTVKVFVHSGKARLYVDRDVKAGWHDLDGLEMVGHLGS